MEVSGEQDCTNRLTELHFLPAGAQRHGKYLEYAQNFHDVTGSPSLPMTRLQFIAHYGVFGMPADKASQEFANADDDGSGKLSLHEYILVRHRLDGQAGSGEQSQEAKLTTLGYFPAGAPKYHLYEQWARTFQTETGGKDTMGLEQFTAYMTRTFNASAEVARTAFQAEDADGSGALNVTAYWLHAVL